MNTKKYTLILLLIVPYAISSLPVQAEYIDLPDGSMSSLLADSYDEQVSPEMSEAENQLDSSALEHEYDMAGMMPGGRRFVNGRDMTHWYRPYMDMPPGQGRRHMWQDGRRYLGDYEPRPQRGEGYRYRSRRHMDNRAPRDSRGMHDSRAMPMMGMMHEKHEHMHARMTRMEKKLGNIEFLLRQLLAQQKK